MPSAQNFIRRIACARSAASRLWLLISSIGFRIGSSTHSSILSFLKSPTRLGSRRGTVTLRDCGEYSIGVNRGCRGWSRERERHWTSIRRFAARHMDEVFIADMAIGYTVAELDGKEAPEGVEV
jgi:hypothetical protein